MRKVKLWLDKKKKAERERRKVKLWTSKADGRKNAAGAEKNPSPDPAGAEKNPSDPHGHGEAEEEEEDEEEADVLRRFVMI